MLGYYYLLFKEFENYFICHFSSVMLPYFSCPKSCYTLQGTKKKNHDNYLKNKKVIQS